MENFTIVVNGQTFNFKKNQYGYYEVTPFDESVSIENLSNALIEQRGYYIASCGEYNPIPVSGLDDGEVVIPFYIRERCFIVKIEKSQSSRL